MTDPESIAALVDRMRNGPYTCSRITGEILELLDAADTIEALQAEVAELRSWKAAEDAHHHLLRQQAKDGFAAGVEAAAKVCLETGQSAPLNNAGACYIAIRALLQTGDGEHYALEYRAQYDRGYYDGHCAALKGTSR